MKQDVLVHLHYDPAGGFDPDWQDHTGEVLVRDQIGLTRGRQDWGSQPPPDTASLSFRGWGLASRDPASPLYGLVRLGTPLRVTVDGQVRFVGAITALSPRGALKGDRWVEVEAAGDTRRAGMGTDLAEPALARATVEEPTVGGAWSLAGLGQSVTQIPALVGQPGVARPTDSGQFDFVWQWSADTLAPGLGALPTVTSPNTGLGFTGRITRATSATTRGWSFWTRAELDPLQNVQATVWLDTTNTSWVLWVLHGADPLQTVVRVLGFDSEGTNVVWLEPASPLPYTDQWTNYAVIVRTGGGGVVTLLVNGQDVPLTVFSGSIPTTAAGAAVRVRATATLPEGRSVSIGYPTYLATAVVGGLLAPLGRLYEAGRGHAGEPAGRRIERLALQENVPLTVVGDLDDTELVGQQHPEEVLAIAREAADTDLGFLLDARDTDGWLYRTHNSLYNQTPALVLDFTDGQMAPPFDPVVDFQGVRNDVTASGRDGGHHRATRLTGAMSVLAPPEGIGRWPDDPTVNVANDAHLPNQAGWRLHLGTVDAARFPRVSVDLVAAPELADDVAAVDVGDVIELINLPADLGTGPVRLMVQGYTDQVGSHTRVITFNTTPADGWTVATYADDEDTPGPGEPARYDTAGSEVEAEFAAGTDTSLSVATTLGPEWTLDTATFPFDVNIAGARVRVTGISGGTSPQTFTVEAATINGVTKTVPAGTPVSLWAPARYAL